MLTDVIQRRYIRFLQTLHLFAQLPTEVAVSCYGKLITEIPEQ